MSERPAASFQRESLEAATAIEINLQRAGLIVEADQELDNEVMLLVEPEVGAPVLRRSVNRITIEQDGRYRSDAPAVLRVPASELPGIAIQVARGDVSVEGVVSTMAIMLANGQLDVSGGEGELVINIGKGNVAIHDHRGDVILKGANGDLAIQRSEGSHVLNIARGNVALTDCASTLNLKLARGDVGIVRPVDSAIRVDLERGNVGITGGSVRNLNIDLTHGDIASETRLLYTPESARETEDLTGEEFDLGEVQEIVAGLGDLLGGTASEDAESGEQMRFNLGSIQFVAGESGVRITRGGTDLFRAGPEGVEVRRGDGSEVFVASEGGIRTSRRRGPEQYRLTTNRGNIRIDIPDDQAARVELIVNSGTASSDIPLVEVGRPGPRSTTRRYVGVSDSSDPERVLVRARTNRGDINVRTVPMRPHAPEPSPVHRRPDKATRRRAILEALARGDLSPAEAETLIEAIDRERD